jgi:hypothetical protein
MDANDQVVFFSPSGRAIGATGKPTRLGDDPVGDLVRANRDRGVEPTWDTGMPRHHRDPVDLEADAWHALDRAAEMAEAASAPPQPSKNASTNSLAGHRASSSAEPC